MAQLVKQPTLDFGSGHDLLVGHGIETHVQLCTDRAEPAWDSFSLSLPLPPSLILLLSLKINKLKKKLVLHMVKIHISVK